MPPRMTLGRYRRATPTLLLRQISPGFLWAWTSDPASNPFRQKSSVRSIPQIFQYLWHRIGESTMEEVVGNIMENTFNEVRGRDPCRQNAVVNHIRPQVFEYTNCRLVQTARTFISILILAALDVILRIVRDRSSLCVEKMDSPMCTQIMCINKCRVPPKLNNWPAPGLDDTHLS
jgi:hypothetical protein